MRQGVRGGRAGGGSGGRRGVAGGEAEVGQQRDTRGGVVQVRWTGGVVQGGGHG